MKENCSSCNGQNQWSGRGRSMGMNRGCGNVMEQRGGCTGSNTSEMERRGENASSMENEMRERSGSGCSNMNEMRERSGSSCSNMNEMRGRSVGSCSNMNGMRRRGSNAMSNRNEMRERMGCAASTQNECSCNRSICNREMKPVDSMMPGMGYVPWQRFDRLLDAREGFMVGTIFEELVLPFCGRPCAGKGMNCR